MNTTFGYDLVLVMHQAGSTVLDGAAYTYDAAGNRTAKSALPANATYTYSYDPIYELTQALQTSTGKATEKYTYDPVGNRLSQPGVPYTYNSSNEMLTREGVPYTYDANGSTLSKTNGSGTTSYTWDYENRLTSLTVPGTGTVSFAYDPFGRRIENVSPSGTTIYVYDGGNIIEELNANGTLGERYTYGPRTDEPLVGQRQPKIFYYEADGLGSVTSLTDPTGAVAATYTYDSFGFMTASTGSATNWFRYTARQFDSDTALYYYRARYYDPVAGRFLSEDPLGFAADMDFYRYVGNDPEDFTDPFGLRDIYVLLWYPQNGSVGHAMSTELNGATINSQWPNTSGYWAQNDTLNLADTLGRESRPPDYTYIVHVPDDGPFNVTAANQRSAPWWVAFPHGTKQTNCVNAVAKALNSGGVPVANGYSSPADLGDRLAQLSLQKPKPGQTWSVSSTSFSNVPGVKH